MNTQTTHPTSADLAPGITTPTGTGTGTGIGTADSAGTLTSTRTADVADVAEVAGSVLTLSELASRLSVSVQTLYDLRS